jgi:hypothetical protein
LAEYKIGKLATPRYSQATDEQAYASADSLLLEMENTLSNNTLLTTDRSTPIYGVIL